MKLICSIAMIIERGKAKILYLTIILRARIGYEMVDSQQGA